MQAIIRIFGIHLAFIIGKTAIEVEVFNVFLVSHRFQHPINDSHVGIALGVAREEAVAVVGGQNALHNNLGAWRLLFDALHDFTHVEGDGIIAIAVVHVVSANHEKDHGGLTFGDGLKTVEHAQRDVAADATILAIGVLEQLKPLSAVGDAVAEEDDVFLRGWHGLEEQFALVVVGAVFARNLGKGLCCHQEDGGHENVFVFHF